MAAAESTSCCSSAEAASTEALRAHTAPEGAAHSGTGCRRMGVHRCSFESTSCRSSARLPAHRCCTHVLPLSVLHNMAQLAGMAHKFPGLPLSPPAAAGLPKSPSQRPWMQALPASRLISGCSSKARLTASRAAQCCDHHSALSKTHRASQAQPGLVSSRRWFPCMESGKFRIQHWRLTARHRPSPGWSPAAEARAWRVLRCPPRCPRRPRLPSVQPTAPCSRRAASAGMLGPEISDFG